MTEVNEYHFELPLKNDGELALFVEKAFGVHIPDVQVCVEHTTPWCAFSDAYFARYPITVWKASRGFGGKSFLLALLGLVEAVTLKASVSILGGSGEQSANVLRYCGKFWNFENAPDSLLDSDVQRETRISWGNTIRALTASQTSVRGPHRPRLRLDEIDEMPLKIFDAAMGQTMAVVENGEIIIPAQTVASSTHQYADGTMTEVLKRAAQKDWPVQTWCYRETSTEGGWLLQSEIERKRSEVTAAMWCFPPEQRVLTASATPVAIANIAGEVLAQHGEQHKIVKRFVRETSETLLEIDVRGISEPLRVTANHKILTVDGWKRAINVKKGDALISPKRPLIPGGDYDSGYLVGLYLAEGTARKDRGNRIGFALHEDECNEVESVIDAWCSKHSYDHNTTGFAPGNAHTRYGDRGKVGTVYISHRLLRELIEQWVDVEQTALDKCLKKLPEKQDFAQGVVDGWLFGDGCETPQGRTGVTYSEDLAWQMMQLGTDLDYAVGLSYCSPTGMGFSDNPFYHVRINHFSGGWRRDPAIIAEAVQRYNDGEPTRSIARDLHVGRNNIKKWATQDPPRQGNNQILALDVGVGRQVTEVSQLEYSGPVYDLMVDENHTYLANGMVVSNSTEYDLQEPSPESRAIQPDKAREMFKAELGRFKGGNGEYIEIEAPVVVCRECDREQTSGARCNACRQRTKKARYATGADWAKKRDWTVIITLRCDVDPVRVVAFERCGRMPWPVMVGKFEKQIKRFNSRRQAIHDGTGLGDVVNDHLTVRAQSFIMVGRSRSDILSNYINAIEDGAIVSPEIEFMQNEHKYASVDDVYGRGHLPDSICAGALAWSKRKRVRLVG